ncbi:UDP-N-acetylmuramoyl-tripeptide--D-alanyl-D-alanine ligase [Thermoactinomyces sp. CICC 23799]|uniref:UDP-N-acetylmuramoyl-tripeptide--D-alanyl-D- alanine ligase n=1 Tax=Thermoactinomyces sp. CICC 23799 TaxID=2767429 RepID=UPI0018DB1E22|nr:UDP-N-acetylmuramoyl-tripeptide--D-alanyl-D-alanine ligase [Thermoactinomyces sp. CICC 23799]MBH8600165.1 UDP-N-acetylmuramoyl-tripeptide--D-alanyl-D-alanine ligase [Thermoactinomyces sp. CICC 23799]
MKAIQLNKLAQIMGGRLTAGSPSKIVQSLNFGNPKQLKPHQVYFYTRKIRWHEKQLPAIQRIRPLAVVLPAHLSARGIPPGTSIIRVQDAYQAFFKAGLWNWKQCPARVIGITGSAGKTTTTEMVASILKYRAPMVKTHRNLNTFSFLPTYLTRLTGKEKLLLLEMGMKSLNNIRKQCQIVRPEIGAVTNVGEAHAGSLGGLHLIVKAKQELVDGVRKNGTLILNADDPRSRKLKTNRFQGKILTFGIRNPAHIRGKNIRYTRNGMAFDTVLQGRSFPVRIPVFGTHNVYNALTAIGVAWAYGTTIPEIQKGLATFKAPKMRLEFIRTKSGRILINDAWNANPTALRAGLDVLKNVSGSRPKIAVLGDMLELGEYSHQAHRQSGKYAARLGLTQLITLGKRGKIIARSAVANGMSPQRVLACDDFRQALHHLARTPKNAVIYFKASRSLHFEKLVRQLKRL